MDYEKYYSPHNDYPVFRGIKNQKGYGIGNVFKKFFRFFMPIIKEHGLPILKTIGKSVLKGTTDFADDVLEGKDFKQSAKKRIDETFDNLKKKASMKGNGIKRRRLTKKLHKKRSKDIFD